MGVALRCDTARGRRFAPALAGDARRLLSALELSRCELSLLLTDDRAIRVLNREFRGRDQPTDVLSFSQLEAAPPRTAAGRCRPGRIPNRRRGTSADERVAPGAALGDVIISIDTTRRQARELGTSCSERLRVLLIHGVLHLLGYDHERSPAAARAMFARERELAETLSDAGGDRGAKVRTRR